MKRALLPLTFPDHINPASVSFLLPKTSEKTWFGGRDTFTRNR